MIAILILVYVGLSVITGLLVGRFLCEGGRAHRSCQRNEDRIGAKKR